MEFSLQKSNSFKDYDLKGIVRSKSIANFESSDPFTKLIPRICQVYSWFTCLLWWDNGNLMQFCLFPVAQGLKITAIKTFWEWNKLLELNIFRCINTLPSWIKWNEMWIDIRKNIRNNPSLQNTFKGNLMKLTKDLF